jgi:hypothetical protein
MKQRLETEFATYCGARLQSGSAELEIDQVKKID